MAPEPQDEFLEILISLLPNLRRFALSLTRRPDQAEDLVQITAERALGARAALEPGVKIEAWLFRILRNAFIDQTRREKTQGAASAVDVYETPEAAVVDGEALVETRLMLGAAQAAMEALAPEQRQVMILVCQEEMSYAETAEILGIPVGTVMSRLARARLAVARHLGIS